RSRHRPNGPWRCGPTRARLISGLNSVPPTGGQLRWRRRTPRSHPPLSARCGCPSSRCLEMPKMGLNERLFLIVDSAKLPQHIAALGTFARPPGAGPGFLDELSKGFLAAQTFAAPFNYQLRNRALRRIAPSWRVLNDSQIDLQHHFHRHTLPAPGGEREFGELVSALHSERLDW